MYTKNMKFCVNETNYYFMHTILLLKIKSSSFQSLKIQSFRKKNKQKFAIIPSKKVFVQSV